MQNVTHEHKKIFIVFILLIVLVVGMVVVRWKKADVLKQHIALNWTTTDGRVPPPTPLPRAIYRINLEDVPVASGGTFRAKLVFEAKGFTVLGSDAIIQFDPSFLTVVEPVSPGTFFITYPRKTIDTQKGIVKISGFEMQKLRSVDQSVEFATITFQALKVGTTALKFDFEKNSTAHTTVVEKGSAKNILDAVVNADIIIK